MGIKFTELGISGHGIRIDYTTTAHGLDLPLVLHEKKLCESAMDMYIHLALELKSRNAWVDGKLFRDVPTPEDCANDHLSE